MAGGAGEVINRAQFLESALQFLQRVGEPFARAGLA